MIAKGEFEGVVVYKHQRAAKIRCLIASKNKDGKRVSVEEREVFKTASISR